MSSRRFVLGILGFGLLFSAPGRAAAGLEEAPAPSCLRAALETPPVWSWGGAWSADGIRLLLVDGRNGSLVLYDTGGRLLETLRRPGTGSLDFNTPNYLRPAEDGYWIRDGATRLVFLDHELTPRKGIDPGTIEPGAHGVPRGYFNWTAAAGRLYGLGDVFTSEGTWQRGWLEMDFEDPRRTRIFRPAPSDQSVHQLLRLGYQYAASEGERAYFLLLDGDGVGILQVAPRVRRLRSFPEGFDSLPRTPPIQPGRNLSVVYGVLEHATYPVGLYAWGGRLFVLTRSPAGEGRTRWLLHGVDPERDELTGAVTLPTETAHLSLLPGPTHWAVIEKGSVEGEMPTRQPVERVTFLASHLFEDLDRWPADPCRSQPATQPASQEVSP